MRYHLLAPTPVSQWVIDSFRFGDSYRIFELCELVPHLSAKTVCPFLGVKFSLKVRRSLHKNYIIHRYYFYLLYLPNTIWYLVFGILYFCIWLLGSQWGPFDVLGWHLQTDIPEKHFKGKTRCHFMHFHSCGQSERFFCKWKCGKVPIFITLVWFVPWKWNIQLRQW